MIAWLVAAGSVMFAKGLVQVSLPAVVIGGPKAHRFPTDGATAPPVALKVTVSDSVLALPLIE